MKHLSALSFIIILFLVSCATPKKSYEIKSNSESFKCERIDVKKISPFSSNLLVENYYGSGATKEQYIVYNGKKYIIYSLLPLEVEHAAISSSCGSMHIQDCVISIFDKDKKVFYTSNIEFDCQ